MKVAHTILLGTNIVAWGGFVWLGRNDTGIHFEYYEALPALMLAVTTIPAVVLWKMNQSGIGTAWSAAGLFALLPYLFFYTGGM